MSPEGPITAGGGYAATLRDYTRLASFYANKGVLDGKQLVPDGWFEQATVSAIPDKGYGYQWWTYDKPGDAAVHEGALSDFQSIWPRKARVRSCSGARKKVAESADSTTRPLSMKITRCATSRAKPISCVTTSMVMCSSAS